MTEHTKLPWKVGARNWIYSADSSAPIMEPYAYFSKDDAEFIVKAVNNHYKLITELLNILSQTISVDGPDDDFQLINKKILDKAKTLLEKIK